MRATGDMEEVVAVRGLAGRVRVCEEDNSEGGEDGLRRFAGWKKSVRVLEDAIFIPCFQLSVTRNGGGRWGRNLARESLFFLAGKSVSVCSSLSFHGFEND